MVLTMWQWLQVLDEPDRSFALEYLNDSGNSNRICFNLREAIHGGFVWDNTSQHHAYWDHIWQVGTYELMMRICQSDKLLVEWFIRAGIYD